MFSYLQLLYGRRCDSDGVAVTASLLMSCSVSACRPPLCAIDLCRPGCQPAFAPPPPPLPPISLGLQVSIRAAAWQRLDHRSLAVSVRCDRFAGAARCKTSVTCVTRRAFAQMTARNVIHALLHQLHWDYQQFALSVLPTPQSRK